MTTQSENDSGTDLFGFSHVKALVRRYFPELLNQAGRPSNLDGTSALICQTKMNSQIAAASEPDAAGYTSNLRHLGRLTRQLRTDG